MGKAGKREYVQVLRLLETFDLEVLHGAVKDALRLGAIGYDAVRIAQQDAGSGVGAMRIRRASVRISSRSATAEPARPISPSVSVWRPAKRGSPSASSRPLPWFMN